MRVPNKMEDERGYHDLISLPLGWIFVRGRVSVCRLIVRGKRGLRQPALSWSRESRGQADGLIRAKSEPGRSGSLDGRSGCRAPRVDRLTRVVIGIEIHEGSVTRRFHCGETRNASILPGVPAHCVMDSPERRGGKRQAISGACSLLAGRGAGVH